MQPFIDEQGRIVLSIHALVIETSEHTIVVDTLLVMINRGLIQNGT